MPITSSIRSAVLIELPLVTDPDGGPWHIPHFRRSTRRGWTRTVYYSSRGKNVQRVLKVRNAGGLLLHKVTNRV